MFACAIITLRDFRSATGCLTMRILLPYMRERNSKKNHGNHGQLNCAANT